MRSSMKEQRSLKRIKINLPVIYTYFGEYKVTVDKGMTADISDSGMGFYTDKPLRAGLTLDISHKPGGVPLQCPVVLYSVEVVTKGLQILRQFWQRIGRCFVEILSNVVDQHLTGGEYRWGLGEQQAIIHLLCLEHLGLAIGKRHTGSDQSHQVRRIDAQPALLGSQQQLEGHGQSSFPTSSSLRLLGPCFHRRKG